MIDEYRRSRISYKAQIDQLEVFRKLRRRRRGHRKETALQTMLKAITGSV
jgi:hypothetical protein